MRNIIENKAKNAATRKSCSHVKQFRRHETQPSHCWSLYLTKRSMIVQKRVTILQGILPALVRCRHKCTVNKGCLARAIHHSLQFTQLWPNRHRKDSPFLAFLKQQLRNYFCFRWVSARMKKRTGSE